MSTLIESRVILPFLLFLITSCLGFFSFFLKSRLHYTVSLKYYLASLIGLTFGIFHLFETPGYRYVSFKIILLILSSVFAYYNKKISSFLLFAYTIYCLYFIHLADIFDKYSIFPFFLLFCSACILLNFKKKLTLIFVHISSFFYFLLSCYFELRGGLFFYILFITLLATEKIRSLIANYLKFLPFLYILILSLIFLNFKYENNLLLDFTGSNFERSVMMFSFFKHAYSFIFIGPGLYYDSLVSDEIKNSGFIFSLYFDNNGVDPHNFFVSIWRDEGLIVLCLFTYIWFAVWKNLMSNNINTHENIISSRDTTIGFCMLAYAISTISFSTSDLITLIYVSLSFGIALALLYPSQNTFLRH
jgi:hypothetical protein